MPRNSKKALDNLPEMVPGICIVFPACKRLSAREASEDQHLRLFSRYRREAVETMRLFFVHGLPPGWYRSKMRCVRGFPKNVVKQDEPFIP
jgi:hypothetical protein